MFTGPGIVEHGAIVPLARKQTIEELADNLIICPPAQMVEQLAAYEEVGIDDVIVSSNIGQSQSESLEAMQRLAEEVMPHFVRQLKPGLSRMPGIT